LPNGSRTRLARWPNGWVSAEVTIVAPAATAAAAVAASSAGASSVTIQGATVVESAGVLIAQP
jgi:hypothetical protein